ncbi:branched-chain amino acid transport system permease protein [Bradyrhizobium sp. USDA 4486]
MAGPALIPAGDFRTSYAADTTIFPTTTSRNFAIVGVALLCLAPQFFTGYWLSILIQIGIFSIAALGLNILVGFTGQISIGHAAFFLLGAFTSAYISNNAPIPVFFAIPLTGVITAMVGLIFGIPAARLKGLYLVIATLAAQYILLDFFSRAEWFSGGSVPASANPFSIFGYTLRGDKQYFYVVLAYVLASYILVTNLMRTRDGRALVAIRDHYLSAEIMGINLTKYRTLSFGLAAFFAGIAGALYAHYQLVVSQEGFGIERSILFLAMIIIGGTGSIMGTLMGTAFVVLLPETMEFISLYLKGGAIDKALSLNNNITFLREIAIGLIIIAFLMFEPDGLAHRWRQIKAYWKLYPVLALSTETHEPTNKQEEATNEDKKPFEHCIARDRDCRILGERAGADRDRPPRRLFRRHLRRRHALRPGRRRHLCLGQQEWRRQWQAAQCRHQRLWLPGAARDRAV